MDFLWYTCALQFFKSLLLPWEKPGDKSHVSAADFMAHVEAIRSAWRYAAAHIIHDIRLTKRLKKQKKFGHFAIEQWGREAWAPTRALYPLPFSEGALARIYFAGSDLFLWLASHFADSDLIAQAAPHVSSKSSFGLVSK